MRSKGDFAARSRGEVAAVAEKGRGDSTVGAEDERGSCWGRRRWVGLGGMGSSGGATLEGGTKGGRQMQEQDGQMSRMSSVCGFGL